MIFLLWSHLFQVFLPDDVPMIMDQGSPVVSPAAKTAPLNDEVGAGASLTQQIPTRTPDTVSTGDDNPLGVTLGQAIPTELIPMDTPSVLVVGGGEAVPVQAPSASCGR